MAIDSQHVPGSGPFYSKKGQMRLRQIIELPPSGGRTKKADTAGRMRKQEWEFQTEPA